MTRLGRRLDRLADRRDPEPGVPYLALARGLLAAARGDAPGGAESVAFARALAATGAGPTWLAVVALAGREERG